MVDMTYRGPVSMSTKFAPAGISMAGGAPVDSGAGATKAAAVGPVSLPSMLIDSQPGSISPLTWLLGLLAFVVALRLLGDSPKTKIEGAHIHVGGYNVITILGIVWFGTTAAKVIANKTPDYPWIRGLKDVINTA